MKFIKNFPKKIILLIFIGLVVRLVLMPITLHPDLWAISFSEYFFAFKGVTNIYDYLASLPSNFPLVQNYGRNFFTYPPLAYFTFGIFGIILRPFFSQDFFKNLAVFLPNILNDNRIYFHLFLTKLPYLFFDFGLLILLTKLFKEEKDKILVAVLWLFNPLSLYTSFMVGQFDIIPVFFTVLSLFLVKKNKWGWAAFSLGIGGAYKMFPLFFLPFLAISGGKTFFEKMKIFFIGLIPYVFTIAPFLGSINFRQTVLLSNQSQKMLFAKIPVSGAEYLSVFVVIYFFLLAFSLTKNLDLWKWFLMVMMLFFGITHYHPQWFLWLTPFLIVFWVKDKRFISLPLMFILSWFLILLFFESSLSIGLFLPIFPQLATTIPFIDIFSKFFDPFVFKSLVRSIFAGLSLFVAALLFKENEAF